MSQFSENENWYVCSIVVQARPEKLNQVKEAILAIPTAEIHDIPGVIVVSLISNYLDEK